MAGLLTAVLVLGSVLYLVWRAQRRRLARAVVERTLDRAAELLGGQRRYSPRDEARGGVRYLQGDRAFTLLREEHWRAGSPCPCTVVEAQGTAPATLALELGDRGPGTMVALPEGYMEITSGDAAFDARVVVRCPHAQRGRAQRLLDDAELRRLLGYALDRHGARLHLGRDGAWLECHGFPTDGELVVALARTTAQALEHLLTQAAQLDAPPVLPPPPAVP